MNLENDYILNLLKKTGNEIYLVGGVVRDILLKRENHDKDIIVTDVSAKDFALKFSSDNDGVCITLDEENNIYRVVMPDKVNYVDVTNPINGSLEDDIKRRDLTINAVAINLKTEEFIDIVNGLEDIEQGVIRGISEQNFVDDYLRIIRAYRFASVLGFGIEPQTREWLRKHSENILKPAVERRNVEVIKLFGGKFADRVLLEMDKDGIIDILFPVMIDVKKVPPNTHHHLDLFHHSVETVKQIQLIFEQSSDEVKEHLLNIDFGGDTRLAHLKFAGFLHDIGKFSTWTIEGDRHRFIRHDEVGAELTKKVLKQDKFSKKQIEYVGAMVRNHIYPSSVISAPNANEKIYMRYVRKAGDDAIDMIVLAKADRLSARGVDVTDDMVRENLSGLGKLLEFYIEIKPRLKPLPKLLSGEDIMKLRGIKPSKELGTIVKALHEAQMDGDVVDKDGAVQFVLNF
ncbi:MAG: HD domain-containing protein [Candidatus Gastranaerophilales bacterium]|nr:HD domain-containing protein [Candidatus Gastranaerophilales bacterium]